MENKEPKTRTFYELLDTQTFNERKQFVAALNKKGITRQQISNWISKRTSVPQESQKVICELAGETLAFPKLVRKVFIES